jgi:hypothetical protein
MGNIAVGAEMPWLWWLIWNKEDKDKTVGHEQLLISVIPQTLVWRRPEIVIVATPALCGETLGIAEVQPVQSSICNRH